MQDLILGKVAYKIFDKTFKESTGQYNKFKINDQETQDNISQNIAKIKTAMGIEQLFIMDQVHGNKIALIDKNNVSDHLKIDGCVTKTPNLGLAIITADCAPVLFYSEGAEVIGAAHCGWRSSFAGIIADMVKLMRQLTDKKIHAVIGPSIGQKSYEVDAEFNQLFLKQNKANKVFFQPSKNENYYLFDLVGYIKLELIKCGVDILYISQNDTYLMKEKYPSYRRSTHAGEPYNSNILTVIKKI